MNRHCFRLPVGLFVLLVVLLLAARPVGASMPLNIEELLVEESVLKLETGTAFRHGEDHLPLVEPNPQVGGPQLLLRQELEVTEFSSSLRYGVGRALEVNARVSVNQLRWRQPGAGTRRETRQSLDLGLNWLAIAEGSSPALLLQLGTRLADSSSLSGVATAYGTAYRAAATAYRSLDPVVLSLAAGYEWRRPRALSADRLDPGNVVWLAPQLNFAVNPEVTLIAGAGLSVTGADTLGGREVAPRSTLTSLRLGMGLAPGPASTIFFEVDYAASGARSSRLAVDWIYRF